MGTADRADGSRPRVYVVDDDPDVLRMVKKLLERHGYAVEVFASPQAFVKDAVLAPPCCLVLDVHMPGMTGLEVQQVLARSPSPPAIVFVSGFGDVPTSVKAMKAGAVDYLAKPFDPPELVAAVEAGLARSAEQAAARSEAEGARALLARLTPREREVCHGVVRGLRSREIAEELGAAVKTVNIHRSRIMAKLEVDSVAELVRLWGRADQDAP